MCCSAPLRLPLIRTKRGRGGGRTNAGDLCCQSVVTCCVRMWAWLPRLAFCVCTTPCRTLFSSKKKSFLLRYPCYAKPARRANNFRSSLATFLSLAFRPAFFVRLFWRRRITGKAKGAPAKKRKPPPQAEEVKAFCAVAQNCVERRRLKNRLRSTSLRLCSRQPPQIVQCLLLQRCLF